MGEQCREVIAHRQQVVPRAAHAEFGIAVTIKVDRVGRELTRRLFEDFDPVADVRSPRAVDHRIHAVEDQIAHVDDVGAFERDDGVAGGVRGAEVSRGHDLVAAVVAPDIVEERVGKNLLPGGVLLFGGA